MVEGDVCLERRVCGLKVMITVIPLLTIRVGSSGLPKLMIEVGIARDGKEE